MLDILNKCNYSYKYRSYNCLSGRGLGQNTYTLGGGGGTLELAVFINFRLHFDDSRNGHLHVHTHTRTFSAPFFPLCYMVRAVIGKHYGKVPFNYLEVICFCVNTDCDLLSSLFVTFHRKALSPDDVYNVNAIRQYTFICTCVCNMFNK